MDNRERERFIACEGMFVDPPRKINTLLRVPEEGAGEGGSMNLPRVVYLASP